MTHSAGDDSPIENYLDQLVVQLWDGSPTAARPGRHLLWETEAHLRDAAQAAIDAGASPHDAETAAVVRFGSADALARAELALRPLPVRVVIGQVAVTAWLLAGVGAVAVGLAGGVAALIRWFGGDSALVTVGQGQVLAATDCARWLAGNPAARSCRDAAIADWAAETVAYRVALGLLGVLALVSLAWIARRRRIASSPTLLDAVGTTLFVLAAAVTLGRGIDSWVVAHGSGSGQWLSAAPVAMAASVVFGRRLLDDLRAPPRSDGRKNASA